MSEYLPDPRDSSPELATRQEQNAWLWSEVKRLASECSELASAVNQARQFAEQVEAENEDLYELIRAISQENAHLRSLARTPEVREVQHCLAEDIDGHWYVIPVTRYSEWHEFLKNSGENEDAPNWAHRTLGSPSLIVFGSYHDGSLLPRE